MHCAVLCCISPPPPPKNNKMITQTFESLLEKLDAEETLLDYKFMPRFTQEATTKELADEAVAMFNEAEASGKELIIDAKY